MNRPTPTSGLKSGETFSNSQIGFAYFSACSSIDDSRALIRSSALRKNVPRPGVQNRRAWSV